MIISDAFSSLQSVFLDWDGFLINNRFIRSGSEITWENYLEIDFVDRVTASHVARIVENRQYSFQVRDDDSIFQIHYQFDRNRRKIVLANLSFYYTGIVIDENNNEEGIILPNEDDPVGWIRIDYDSDPANDGGVTHAKCHMHVSSLPSTRIIVDRIPNPKQFVDLIIAMCYPDAYKIKRLDANGQYKSLAEVCHINNPLVHEIGLDALCQHAFHMKVPSNIVPPIIVEERAPAKKKNRQGTIRRN